MPYYVMLTKLTDAGRKTIMKNPGRIWEVNQEVEDMGAKILSQYALLGEYDFINILEAPNNTVVARVAASLGARGTLQPLTLSAITIEDLVKELQMARALDR
ncbi:MAG TPA: GYD domain-containing protein [Dehalococcoidales bacterium]|nr:MAG: GYD domain superfamily [Chloroflexi bacterium RBG_16_60_22]HJX13750.1 GYD domain-containing protein [Dehalococcoidales bacterium]